MVFCKHKIQRAYLLKEASEDWTEEGLELTNEEQGLTTEGRDCCEIYCILY